MNILQILQYIGCILTVVVGLYALVSPKSAANFTGLTPQGGRGVTEIRVILGMLFVVAGLFPMLAASTVAFQMLGYIYLFVGIARLISIFVDTSGNQSNWFSVAFEIVFGVILIL